MHVCGTHEPFMHLRASPQLLHVSIIILQQYNLTFDDVMFFYYYFKKGSVHALTGKKITALRLPLSQCMVAC